MCAAWCRTWWRETGVVEGDYCDRGRAYWRRAAVCRGADAGGDRGRRGEADGREIPVTLHDSLMARLDRLVFAKELAQVGAVIGGDSLRITARSLSGTPRELEQKLRDLVDAELCTRGVAPDATYRFKHALIRDAAYEARSKAAAKSCIGW